MNPINMIQFVHLATLIDTPNRNVLKIHSRTFSHVRPSKMRHEKKIVSSSAADDFIKHRNWN